MLRQSAQQSLVVDRRPDRRASGMWNPDRVKTFAGRTLLPVYQAPRCGPGALGEGAGQKNRHRVFNHELAKLLLQPGAAIGASPDLRSQRPQHFASKSRLTVGRTSALKPGADGQPNDACALTGWDVQYKG